jgi:hypothetical protein
MLSLSKGSLLSYLQALRKVLDAGVEGDAGEIAAGSRKVPVLLPADRS